MLDPITAASGGVPLLKPTVKLAIALLLLLLCFLCFAQSAPLLERAMQRLRDGLRAEMGS